MTLCIASLSRQVLAALLVGTLASRGSSNLPGFEELNGCDCVMLTADERQGTSSMGSFNPLPGLIIPQRHAVLRVDLLVSSFCLLSLPSGCANVAGDWQGCRCRRWARQMSYWKHWFARSKV